MNDLDGAIAHFQAASTFKRRTVETVGIEALEDLEADIEAGLQRAVRVAAADGEVVR